jgi:5'-3' exoribonuclease 2
LLLLYSRYYPYYYAPFASDFNNLKDVFVHFNENSKPFKPLEQLISLLPPQCVKYLPETWQSLISDKDSPISAFYPSSFSIDTNGKRYKSQYIALLPFFDENRLHEVLKNNYSSLTSEEEKRNECEDDLLFIHVNHSSYNDLKKLDANSGEKITRENPFHIPAMIKIPGYLWRDGDDDKIIRIGKTVKAPIVNYNNLSNNLVICFKYLN